MDSGGQQLHRTVLWQAFTPRTAGGAENHPPPEGCLPRTDPKRETQHPFAQEIADRLEEGRLSGQYDTLWLFVSSPLLGELKPALSRATDRRVEVAQDIDFTALDLSEIETRLQGIWQPSS